MSVVQHEIFNSLHTYTGGYTCYGWLLVGWSYAGNYKRSLNSTYQQNKVLSCPTGAIGEWGGCKSSTVCTSPHIRKNKWNTCVGVPQVCRTFNKHLFQAILFIVVVYQCLLWLIVFNERLLRQAKKQSTFNRAQLHCIILIQKRRNETMTQNKWQVT